MLTDFALDKKRCLEKFKATLDQTPEEKGASFAPIYSKETEYSKYDILNKILGIYNFILDVSAIDLRRHYIHDDTNYIRVKHLLDGYVKNKIKSMSDGHIYIRVGNLVKFSGKKDQYEEYFIDNKTKMYQVIRHAIDELNSYLEGHPIEDSEGKPVLYGNLTKEQVSTYVFDMIPEAYQVEFMRGEWTNFDISFRDAMIKFNISEVEWKPVLHAMKELVDIPEPDEPAEQEE